MRINGLISINQKIQHHPNTNTTDQNRPVIWGSTDKYMAAKYTITNILEHHKNDGTTPYPPSSAWKSVPERRNRFTRSGSISVRLANRPLILGRVSAYAFLDAYRMVFSNFRFFLFSLYRKTLASLSLPLLNGGVLTEPPKSL